MIWEGFKFALGAMAAIAVLWLLGWVLLFLIAVTDKD